MIEGFFDSGTPRLKANVWIHRFAVRSSIDMVIDPASSKTTVATGDIRRFGGLPLDDFAKVDGVFGVDAGIAAPAMLSFTASDGLVVAELTDVVLVYSPAGTSRLGRDVLNRWLMVYDPGGINLLFEPYSDSGEDADAPAG